MIADDSDSIVLQGVNIHRMSKWKNKRSLAIYQPKDCPTILSSGIIASEFNPGVILESGFGEASME